MNSKHPQSKKSYKNIHKRRYEYLHHLILQYDLPQNSRVLDIGGSEFTQVLTWSFNHVDALGYQHDILLQEPGLASIKNFFEYDLNSCSVKENWPNMPKYDIIIFAEVIEHLFVPAETALQYIQSLLNDRGIIFLQTPNATSLEKRLRMLVGLPPFDRISAGHFREITREELIEAGDQAGLTCILHEFKDYFGVNGSRIKKLAGFFLHQICRLFPSLRRGQTAVFRNSK